MRFAFGLILIAWFPLSAATLDRQTLQDLDAAQQSLKAAPDSEVKRLTLASLYLKVGQNRSAVEILKTYLQSHPDAPKTLRLLAVAHLREEDYPAAKNAAELALRVWPPDS